MLVSVSSDYISAAWFNSFAEVFIIYNVAGSGLSVNASCCVPGVISSHVFYTVNEVIASGLLALTKIFGYTKLIISNSVVVLNCLFDNNCFWEVFF